MVTVREVVHRLELLVNDANASFVGAVGDFLDILGALAQGRELLVDVLGSFDRCLRVEFSCNKIGQMSSQISAYENTYQDRRP